MGRGVAEHVETNPAAGTLVSRRQSPPVAPLLAILVAADQGSNGVGTHPSLRALQGSSSLLTNGSMAGWYCSFSTKPIVRIRSREHRVFATLNFKHLALDLFKYLI